MSEVYALGEGFAFSAMPSFPMPQFSSPSVRKRGRGGHQQHECYPNQCHPFCFYALKPKHCFKFSFLFTGRDVAADLSTSYPLPH